MVTTKEHKQERKETHEHDTNQRQDSLARPPQIIMHGGGGRACILSFPGLATPFIGCDPRSQPFVVQKDLAGFGFAVVAPSEVFRKISQNFSPAGVTTPFMARAIPTDNTSVVPVSGR